MACPRALVLLAALLACGCHLMRPAAARQLSVGDPNVTLTLLGYTAAADITTLTEQVAFDDAAKRAYLVGGDRLYVLNMAPAALNVTSNGPDGASVLPLLASYQLPSNITDVAVCGDLLAVSIEGATKVAPGQVLMYARQSAASAAPDPTGLTLLANVIVGALPDQIEFSKDCSTLLVSNEGEPEGYLAGQIDPEGSVSVVNIRYCPDPRKRGPCKGAPVGFKVRHAGFAAWNGRRDELLAQGIKISSVSASVAQDLEPEYTTFSEDERTAFVTLQESNAIAVLDVASATITGIFPLGFKDHNKSENALDPSDRDGGANITTWPVHGLYMPDEMKSFRHDGVDYIVTANEGDARSYPGFEEETNVARIVPRLDPTVFGTDANLTLGQPAQLGRLTVINDTSPLNDVDGDGSYERILSYGARSFSVLRVDRRGAADADAGGAARVSGLTQVFDSGSQLERISEELLPGLFNSEGTATSFDRRSDNKGPEPEGVAVGEAPAVGDASPRRCLFLTAERLSVVFVYDISDPASPVFQSLALPPQRNASDVASRFVAPEGITYARYSLSSDPNYSLPIVLVAYEGPAGRSGLGVFRVD